MSEDKLPKTHSIKTLYSFDTEYSADSVEWCPHSPNQNIFVCANYQLTENKSKNENGLRKRVGRILLFSISSQKGLELHQTIHTAAVLDQKWCHNKIDNSSVLGVVNAENKIEVYKLNDLSLCLVDTYEFQKVETETLILSLDWSTGKYESNSPTIVCSDSQGYINLLKFTNNKLVLENGWHGHDFEAWIACFYYWDKNIVFSGGDDSLFCKYDRRVGPQPVAKNRSHEAGVTALHSNKCRENIIATGSYDENVRLWDIRQMKNPLSDIKMPGPLWRLKWDPFGQNYLLAACMLGGVHVVKVEENSSIEIVESYYEHKNIAYGADWSYLNSIEAEHFEHEGNIIIGSCSFYDNLLCVSKFFCEIKTEV